MCIEVHHASLAFRLGQHRVDGGGQAGALVADHQSDVLEAALDHPAEELLPAGRVLLHVLVHGDHLAVGTVPVDADGDQHAHILHGPAPRALVPHSVRVYFVKSRWTLSALNLNTFGVQLEHRRRLVPCFVVCLVYFMRECLFR